MKNKQDDELKSINKLKLLLTGSENIYNVFRKETRVETSRIAEFK